MSVLPVNQSAAHALLKTCVSLKRRQGKTNYALSKEQTVSSHFMHVAKYALMNYLPYKFFQET